MKAERGLPYPLPFSGRRKNCREAEPGKLTGTEIREFRNPLPSGTRQAAGREPRNPYLLPVDPGRREG